LGTKHEYKGETASCVTYFITWHDKCNFVYLTTLM